jgi:DNA-binding response OmpR family regulator
MQSKKILVVEDDAKSRFALTSVLEARGFDVIATSTAEEAASVQGDGMHAAVIDIRLPEQQGTEFALDLRKKHPHMRIILVTAYHEEGALNISLPGAILLIKPIEMDVLCRLL